MAWNFLWKEKFEIYWFLSVCFFWKLKYAKKCWLFRHNLMLKCVSPYDKTIWTASTELMLQHFAFKMFVGLKLIVFLSESSHNEEARNCFWYWKITKTKPILLQNLKPDFYRQGLKWKFYIALGDIDVISFLPFLLICLGNFFGAFWIQFLDRPQRPIVLPDLKYLDSTTYRFWTIPSSFFSTINPARHL